ncbi:MAG: Copper resistance protein B [uncultured Sulfurovum sp.]|uniref:Copper resistance protein B n=1 Tax=uncultured Sulfurovum sp. TaxID=269237 RepID=A0A6S6S5Y6_9BACT|nr:MAG: Copper resistance protein B [uncultured Sulfurovum sp.]
MIVVLSGMSYADMNDDPLYTKVTLDEFEYQGNDEKSFSWDSNIWIGYDMNKIYLYSEGEKAEDGSAESENQLVFSRAIAPFWDVQFGVGYDKTADDSQTWGVVSLQGLSPYYFETRTALLLGEDGNIGLRLETEYEALLTQKLILTPSLSTNIYSKDNLQMGIGKGLSNITAGMRLRYEIKREFAPYVGVEWSKNFGNTADVSPLDETYAVAGVRIWF